MSKPYSNRALPAGTILREWRLEEVLGVGGFGIVYKGRGIYFDELVAIKEYFPSSISERDEHDTVVPVDSKAEEVHALGLKKFVEEAKLLWNLSTPTRHPHIVSVRSLFEIHGTAYMVMDFEDGTPLSQLLKQGIKFNQASLSKIILPVAEGLERAHRVGVLHRDIKPPNIMVGDDDRAVLIDFGSARFESGEATSTTVTFYTPPYAAIEQYVKTYEQGPWTDIYALSVVLYECVTGGKPAEVLERLHGGPDKPLAQGNWPGFSAQFLRAIDAGMTIRPDERPRSIPEWLAMFDEGKGDLRPAVQPDVDATVIATFVDEPKILPIDHEVIKAAQVKDEPEPEPESAGAAPLAAAAAAVAGASTASAGVDAKPVDPLPAAPAESLSAGAAKPEKTAPQTPVSKDAKDGKGGSAKWLVGGAVVLAGVAGVAMFSGLGTVPSPEVTGPVAEVAVPDDVSGYPTLFASLADEAKAAGLGEDAVAMLTIADGDLKSEDDAVARLRQFGIAALAAGEARTRNLADDVTWADISRSNPPAEPAQRKALDALKTAMTDLRDQTRAIGEAQALGVAVPASREAMAALSRLNTLAASAAAIKTADTPAKVDTPATSQTATVVPSQSASAPAPTVSASASDVGVSPTTAREFARIVAEARGIARDVARLGEGRKPGSRASEEEQEGYRTRQASAQSAKQYVAYLDTLESSMRGTTTDAEARNSVAKASQTKSYLQALLNRSRAAK